MYKLELKDNIDSVGNLFWHLNQDTFSKLYRTKEWLRDSQKRLGDIEAYIECYCNDQPVLLIPIIIFQNKTSYSPIDPHKMVENALNLIAFDKPVAISISLFGLGCPILAGRLDIEWETVISKVIDLLRLNYNCDYFVCSFMSSIDNPMLPEKLKNTKHIVLPHKKYGLLNVKKYSNFNTYLKNIERCARRAYYKENELHQTNGIKTKQTSIVDYSFDLLGKLASNVYKKYGSDVNYERLSSFAAYIHNTFEKSGLFISTKGDNVLSYALYIEHNNVLHMKMLGRDYDNDDYSTYFTIAYYAPMIYSLDNDIKYINYGSGSMDTKEKRNVEGIDSYSYVFHK